MSILNGLEGQIKQAMLQKNQGALRALRSIKSALLIAKTDGTWDESKAEEKSIQILQKQAKQRRESMEIFEKQNRADLLEKEKEELEVIESFLPKQLSEEEVSQKVLAIIEKSGASGMKDMGKVMGMASKELAGLADGKLIADIVKTKLGA